MKRTFLSLFLVLLILLTVLTACGEDLPADVGSQTEGTSAPVSDTVESADPGESPADGLVLVQNGETKYTIIRPEKATDEEKDAMLTIRKAIEEKTGVSLSVKDDWIKKGQEHDASTFEILIGNTNYAETAAVMDSLHYGEYAVAVSGNKIVVVAQDNTDYGRLASMLVRLINKAATDGNLVLNEEFPVKNASTTAFNKLPKYDGHTSDVLIKDCGDENMMLYIPNTTGEEYDAYCTKLEADGFVCYDSHAVDKNRFATYTGKDSVVNVTYSSYSKCTRVIVEPTSPMPPLAKDAEGYTAICEPAVRLVGQEMKRYKSDESTIQNALCLIFRLSDGRFIIVDGGYEFEEPSNYLLKNLREMAPDPKRITVAAWFLTHAHGDHTDAFIKMARKNFGGILKVEQIIFNFLTKEGYTHPDGEVDAGRYDQIYALNLSGSEVIKAHTGQRFHYADATIEMLYTVEDYFPQVFDYHNTSSLIFRVNLGGQQIMVLGDSAPKPNKWLAGNYGDYLKSDIVQVAHHGYYGGLPELYNAIQADTILWPGGVVDFDYLKEYDRNKAVFEHATDLFIAGSTQHTLTLPYTPVGNKAEAMKEAAATLMQMVLDGIAQKSDGEETTAD